ncbi:hypothetical protein, partial [Brevibacillus panacihumi]|uniref:hypothetical protein n=1 Tax=Brevibacillus panacihumi TaxID=497735 RepID=UPI003D221ADB
SLLYTLNHFFEAGCFWPRFRLLEWSRPGMTPSEDPNPPGAFSPFSFPALQPDKYQPKMVLL